MENASSSSTAPSDAKNVRIKRELDENHPKQQIAVNNHPEKIEVQDGNGKKTVHTHHEEKEKNEKVESHHLEPGFNINQIPEKKEKD